MFEKMYTSDWQPDLNNFEEMVTDEDDVKQCINIILKTPRGSVPFRPEFGSEIWRFVDYPVNEAIPFVIQDIIFSLTVCEERLKIIRILPEINESKLKFNIEFELKKNNQKSIMEIFI
nr:baseplate protein [bacterium]